MIKRVKDQMMRANRLIDDFDGKRDAWQNSKVMECYNELRGVDAKLRELIRKFSTAKLYLMTSHYVLKKADLKAEQSTLKKN